MTIQLFLPRPMRHSNANTLMPSQFPLMAFADEVACSNPVPLRVHEGGKPRTDVSKASAYSHGTKCCFALTSTKPDDDRQGCAHPYDAEEGPVIHSAIIFHIEK